MDPDEINGLPDEADMPVEIMRAATLEEALVVKATLEAEGLTVLFPEGEVSPAMATLDSEENSYLPLALFVPASQAENARAILNADYSGTIDVGEEV